MKGIFKRMSAEVTGKACEETREQRKQTMSPSRKRCLVRG